MKERIVGDYRVYRVSPMSMKIRHNNSLRAIKLGRVDTGHIRVQVVNKDGVPSIAATASREVIEMVLDMLEGKSDVISPESETISEPEIDPEVELLLSGCEFRVISSSDLTWRCDAKDEGEDGKLPVCHVKTRNDLDNCKDYYTFAETCVPPGQLGE